MKIFNLTLRKSLGMGKKLEADDGAGLGTGTDNTDTGADEGTQDTQTTDGKEDGKKDDKTFTQADVDKMIKDRLAREKKGQLSKEELKAYQDWKESQKTDEEKKNEALTNAEKAKLAAEERAMLAETKVTCLSKGVKADSVDDVVILAKAMVSDDVTIDQAIDKVLEKYPSFSATEQKEEQETQKGFKIGASDKGGTKTDMDDKLKAIFGVKK